MASAVFADHSLDISGNVWEWTRKSSFPYPYVDVGEPEREALEASRHVRRGVRGGSFNVVAGEGLRAAKRGEANPDGRSDNLGFRLVVLRPSRP